MLSDKGGMDKLYNECLDKLLVQYPIDPSRVYLTGMSMGGHGTIWQATQHSEKYAAIMPVCGLFYFEKGGIQVSNLEKIINKPMWFFHSRNDDAVEFSNSPRLIGELQMSVHLHMPPRYQSKNDTYGENYHFPNRPFRAKILP